MFYINMALLRGYCSILALCGLVYGSARRCKSSAGDSVCCLNEEEKNGSCIECRRGYVSRDGGKCMPCPGSSYGYRCLLECPCPKQRCHHVTGCQEQSSMKPLRASTTNSKMTTQRSFITNRRIITQPPVALNITSAYITVSVTDELPKALDESTTMIENMEKYELISVRDLFVYTLSVTSVIVILVVGHVIRRKCKRSRARVPTSFGQVEVVEQEENHDYLDVYQEIDETALRRDIKPTIPSNLEQIDSETHELPLANRFGIENSVKYTDDSEYLDPCYIASKSREPDIDKNKEPKSSDIKVFNQYQPLIQNEKHVGNEYETPLNNKADVSDRTCVYDVSSSDSSEKSSLDKDMAADYLDVILASDSTINSQFDPNLGDCIADPSFIHNQDPNAH